MKHKSEALCEGTALNHRLSLAGQAREQPPRRAGRVNDTRSGAEGQMPLNVALSIVRHHKGEGTGGEATPRNGRDCILEYTC